MEIEFYDIELRGEVADAQYFLGNTNVQQQISRAALLTFITDQRLNVYVNETGCEYVADADTYLEEDYRNIVKLYVNQHHAD